MTIMSVVSNKKSDQKIKCAKRWSPSGDPHKLVGLNKTELQNPKGQCILEYRLDAKLQPIEQPPKSWWLKVLLICEKQKISFQFYNNLF